MLWCFSQSTSHLPWCAKQSHTITLPLLCLTVYFTHSSIDSVKRFCVTKSNILHFDFLVSKPVEFLAQKGSSYSDVSIMAFLHSFLTYFLQFKLRLAFFFHNKALLEAVFLWFSSWVRPFLSQFLKKLDSYLRWLFFATPLQEAIHFFHFKTASLSFIVSLHTTFSRKVQFNWSSRV